jgi:predicted phosphoribosyltransferase
MLMFLDRNEAGEHLAARLLDEPWVKAAASDELLVLSIPRGGGVVGAAWPGFWAAPMSWWP